MTLYKWSQMPASDATADPTINWQEGQAPSTVNDSARAMMAATAKFRDDTNGALTTAGTSTAYTITSNQVFDTLTHLDKQTLTLTVHATSGATPTLNVDSLGAKPIHIATGVSLATGALISGSTYSVTYYNTAGEFLIHDQIAAQPLGANAVVTSNIADANVTYGKLQNVTASRLLGNATGSATAPAEIALGTGLAFSSGALTATISPSLVLNYLSGLTLSTAGSSATFGIAAGVANDTTNSTLMLLASAYTKTTSAWAVGTGNGSLDNSTIANNTWYHVFVIERPDTGVVDICVSVNPGAPTLGGAIPSAYTIYRRIGSMKTNGSGQWTAFTQTGDDFTWAALVPESSSAACPTTRTNLTLNVPTGIVVTAGFRATMNCAASGVISFPSLIENDVAPASVAGAADISTANTAAGMFQRLTDTSGRIGVRSNNPSSCNYSLATYGWRDTRGK